LLNSREQDRFFAALFPARAAWLQDLVEAQLETFGFAQWQQATAR
jgi:hypothetical protein